MMCAMTGLEIRTATLADVPVLSETVRQGFDGYRAFLPAGWEPPAEAIDLKRKSTGKSPRG